jgi:hypothetical protein
MTVPDESLHILDGFRLRYTLRALSLSALESFYWVELDPELVLVLVELVDVDTDVDGVEIDGLTAGSCVFSLLYRGS